MEINVLGSASPSRLRRMRRTYSKSGFAGSKCRASRSASPSTLAASNFSSSSSGKLFAVSQRAAERQICWAPKYSCLQRPHSHHSFGFWTAPTVT